VEVDVEVETTEVGRAAIRVGITGRSTAMCENEDRSIMNDYRKIHDITKECGGPEDNERVTVKDEDAEIEECE
jgi:hypothetical protein